MDCIKNVKEKTPLVHCITNYVTVNDVANVLLACGASPVMADDIDEVKDITSISDALVINIGTLNARTIKSMLAAGKKANELKIPVVFDPVGAGASALRNNTIGALLKEIKFSVIRGNLSEISFIAGLNASARGVDNVAADKDNDSVKIAKQVALKYNCITAITGAVDTVSDGIRVARISNGVAMMSKVTGTGCMLSALVGAYVGANVNKFEAVVSAIALMGIAGEISYQKYNKIGTGHFHMGIIDEISILGDKSLKEKGKIVYEK
jgi:hydroxyethylthiazole kinase